MQHPVTGKWDTLVTVRKKRAEGNSYIVCAQDGNTYIKGRRLLKPINHPQYLIPSSAPTTASPKTTDPKTGAKETKKPKKKKKKNTAEKHKIPRRSPRNPNSSRAADTEIAAR